MNCDGCTLCCKLLKISWMDSPAGEYCKECHPNVKCKIYNKAPKKCLEFDCAYNQMKQVDISLRPDKCGVIFERISENIFIGTMNPDEKELKEDIMGQIDSFVQTGFSVVLFHHKTKGPLIHPTKGTTSQEVWDIIQKETTRRHDST